MPNIWWISDVRPIRAEPKDPEETPSCSCTPHSGAQIAPPPLLLFLLPFLSVFLSIKWSLQEWKHLLSLPPPSFRRRKLPSCFYETGGQLKRGRCAGGGKKSSEVGSRHHLLQMFAAINLLCSACTVHAAAEMDNEPLESAEGA